MKNKNNTTITNAVVKDAWFWSDKCSFHPVRGSLSKINKIYIS